MTGQEVPGWRFLGVSRNIGFGMYVPEDECVRYTCDAHSDKPGTEKKKKRREMSPEARHEYYSRILDEAGRQPDYLVQIVRLAKRLGVRVQAVASLGAVFNLRTLAPKYRGKWAFPEWDAEGHIIGLSTRADDEEGTKGSVSLSEGAACVSSSL